MFSKQLGQTGVLVPEIGLGTWNYHGGAALLQKAVVAGAAFVDTAESYGTETLVGEALSGIRDQVFLATKVSPENFKHADVIKAADRSLHCLRTDRIDLYQLHGHNPNVPIEETMAAMEDLVEVGKIRFIGVSNFSCDELKRAQKSLRKQRIATNQVRYNLIDRAIESELLPYCRETGISIIAYSPLARGLPSIIVRDSNQILAKIASETRKTIAQIAINWCLRHENVFAIPKGNSATHIDEICEASDWRLQPEHIRLLSDQISVWRQSRMEKAVRLVFPKSVQEIASRLVRRLPPGLKRRLGSA